MDWTYNTSIEGRALGRSLRRGSKSDNVFYVSSCRNIEVREQSSKTSRRGASQGHINTRQSVKVMSEFTHPSAVSKVIEVSQQPKMYFDTQLFPGFKLPIQ
eukprot:427045-Hanusia_phi.AAC.3